MATVEGIDKIEADIRRLSKQFDDLNQRKRKALAAGNTQEAKSLESEMKQVGKELREMKRSVIDVDDVLRKLNKVSLDTLYKSQRKLRTELKGMRQDSEEFAETLEKLKRLESQIGQAKGIGKGNGLGLSLGNIIGVSSVAGLAATGTQKLLDFMVQGISKARAVYAEYDDQLADVQKTTGMARDESDALARRLNNINTRTAQQELLGLASAAGRLGIQGVEDVEGFVRAADKINVALGEDLGGDAEDVARQIGKFIDIFDLKKLYGIEDGMIRVGSALNELDNSSTASAGYVVDFTERLAGVAPAAKLSIQNVMGMGATLDQFGQRVETSGTAVSNAITGMFKKTEVYARIAGMELSDFTKLMNEDANAAFIAFLKGLNKNNGGLSELAKNLDSIKLDGSRSVSVISVLAKNVGELERQQTIANEAFSDGTSVLDEFNTKNNNAQATWEKWEKLGHRFAVDFGRAVTPIFNSLIDRVEKFYSSRQQLIQSEMEEYKNSVSQLDSAKKRAASLTKTYDDLMQKTELSKEEQYLLNRSIEEIGEICPAAITKTDEYGRAIEINIDRLNRAIEAQEKLNKKMQEQTASAVFRQIKEQSKSLSAALRDMQQAADDMDAQNAGVYVPEAVPGMWVPNPRPANDPELRYNTNKDRVRDLQMDLKQNIIFLTELGVSYDDIAAATGRTVAQVEELIGVQKELQQTTEEAGNGDQTKPKPDLSLDLDDKNKSKKKWTLEQDAEFMAQRIALRKQLTDGLIATEEEYEKKLLALEISALERRIGQEKEKGTDLQRLQADLADKRYRQTKTELERQEQLRALAMRDDGSDDRGRRYNTEDYRFAQELKKAGLGGDRTQMTAAEHAALENLERIHARKMQDIYVGYLTDEFEKTQAAHERELNEMKIRHNRELAEQDTLQKKKDLLRRLDPTADVDKIRTEKEAVKRIRAEYDKIEQESAKAQIETLLETYKKYMTEVENIMDGDISIGALDEDGVEKIQKIVDELNEQLAKIKPLKPDNDDNWGKVDVLGMTADDWDIFLKNLKDGQATTEEWLHVLGAVGNAFQLISSVMSAAEQRELKEYEKTSKRKKAKLDAELKAKKISQEQYSSAVQKIDDETERKREEASRKQAVRDKAVAVFQSLINTASAVTEALPNIPLSVAVGILGAIQTGVILATPLPGAEQGGFLDVERQQDGRRFHARNTPDKRGYVSTPSVIVAEAGTEYVVPNEGYENPTIRPVLDIIESARRSGTLRSIDLPAVLNGRSYPGRASGGYVSPDRIGPADPTTGGASAVPSGMDERVIERLAEALDRMEHRLGQPFDVRNYAGGRHGIARAMNKYDKIRDNASL